MYTVYIYIYSIYVLYIYIRVCVSSCSYMFITFPCSDGAGSNESLEEKLVTSTVTIPRQQHKQNPSNHII